ncbi:MAG: hypothetical protein ACTSQJ_10985 [Promethearchaeota archaeon]
MAENPKLTYNRLKNAPSTSDRITFTHQKSGVIGLPFRAELFDNYVQADTNIGIDWLLELPIDVLVNYENIYEKGESNDLSVNLSLPADQAHFKLDISVDFDLSWHIIGVKDGTAKIIDYDTTIEKYFTTPIGKYNLPISAKYGIPVSISGVPIGTLYITATPQIISTIRAKLLSNPNFYESLILEWEKNDIKTITLSSKPDAPDTDTVVTIGDFEYVISIGIEWAISFEFVKPFNLINIFLEQLGYPLEFVLGTWPKIEIGALPSPDNISLPITIQSINETGADFNHAIGFDSNDWYTSNKIIALPGPAVDNKKYYTFTVQKDWQYDFQITSATNGVNVDATIYNENYDVITSANGGSYPDTLSFVAKNNTNYYLVFTPDSGTPCTSTVRFTAIRWPGKTRSYPIELEFPFEGALETLTITSSGLWYNFSGIIGHRVSFWCYEFNENDDIDIYLYYGANLKDLNTSNSDCLKSISFVLDASGVWYFSVNATSLENGEGNYWLDYSYSNTNTGHSSASPIIFTNTYEGNSLGTEESTQGGIWLQTNCNEKRTYKFKFNGQKESNYDFILYDSDLTTIIGGGTFSGTIKTISYTCLSSEAKYIHILPYTGGFTFNISKSSEVFYYIGEDADHALTIEDNFEVKAELPNNWGGNTYWDKIYLRDAGKLFIKLDFDEANNFDLYLYDHDGNNILESSWKNNPEIISYDIDASGWYKILIDRVKGSGPYTLSIAIPQEYDLKSESFSLDFSPENVNNYFNIYLEEGETITFDLKCTGYRAMYVDLYLYDSELKELESDKDGPHLTLSFKAEKSGDYFFRVYNEELGEGEIYGTVEVSSIEETQLNILLFLTIILIPIFIGIAFFMIIYIRKVKYGEWFWQEDYFKYKMSNFKEKYSKIINRLKGKISIGIVNIKKKLKNKKAQRIIGAERLKISENIEFPLKDDSELSEDDLKVLKNAQLSKRISDPKLKKIWDKSLEENKK